MRTVEEFQAQVNKLGLSKWTVDKCSICRCDCAYVFQNGQVFYDASCRCVTDELELVSWDEIAEHYNVQCRPEVTAAMDAFWGFGGSELKSRLARRVTRSKNRLSSR